MDENKLHSGPHYVGSPNNNHDQYIYYTLDNAVGTKLAVSKVDDKICLSLLSKQETPISTVSFDAGGSGGSGLIAVSLDNTGKRLIFATSDGMLECDLTDLYNQKQDVITDLKTIRINAMSGKEAKELLAKKETIWDGKSTVTVASSGAATREIRFITIDGTEYKIGVDYEEVQKKLKAGDNITIDEKTSTISAKDTVYHQGEGISIDENNTISLSADVTDYNKLDNKPSINGVELIGALLGKDLKLDQVEYMTYKKYVALGTYEKKFYFVCRNEKAVESEDCWRIYLQNKLIGEWDVEGGSVVKPVFPMRIPCVFAGKDK